MGKHLGWTIADLNMVYNFLSNVVSLQYFTISIHLYSLLKLLNHFLETGCGVGGRCYIARAALDRGLSWPVTMIFMHNLYCRVSRQEGYKYLASHSIQRETDSKSSRLKLFCSGEQSKRPIKMSLPIQLHHLAARSMTQIPLHSQGGSRL